MTSLAITIRTVDSVPSWPTPAARGQKLGQPTFGRRTSCKVCEASEISVDPLFHPPIGIVSIQYRPQVAGRGEKSDATRMVSTFGA
jgi:hypothetical protein